MGDRRKSHSQKLESHRPAPTPPFLVDSVGIPWKEPKLQSQQDSGSNPNQQHYNYLSEPQFLHKTRANESTGRGACANESRLCAGMRLAQYWHILGAFVADRLQGGPDDPHL